MKPALWRDARYAIWWLVVGADVIPATPADYQRAVSEGWPMTSEVHDQRLKAACHRNGLTVADLPKAA
jgi:hypothetical protein